MTSLKIFQLNRIEHSIKIQNNVIERALILMLDTQLRSALLVSFSSYIHVHIYMYMYLAAYIIVQNAIPSASISCISTCVSMGKTASA